MVLAYLALAAMPWLTLATDAGRSQTAAWRWLSSVAYPLRVNGYLPDGLRVPLAGASADATDLGTALWVLGNVAAWIALLVVISLVLEQGRREVTFLTPDRTAEAATPFSRVAAALTIGLAVAYVAAALHATQKFPTPLSTLLSCVVYPLRPRGYLPENLTVELGTTGSGFDAGGIEWLLAMLLNVGLWVVLIGAFAVASCRLLRRRT
jgi:hypothetical protein